MSVDAKMWTEEDGSWSGTHDGPCLEVAHKGAPWDASIIMTLVWVAWRGEGDGKIIYWLGATLITVGILRMK